MILKIVLFKGFIESNNLQMCLFKYALTVGHIGLHI